MVNYPDDSLAGRSIWRFRKTKAFECDCRRRKHGQPHLSIGDCYGDFGPGWRKAVWVRIHVRRLERSLLRTMPHLTDEAADLSGFAFTSGRGSGWRDHLARSTPDE